jgi:hypothetical protein
MAFKMFGPLVPVGAEAFRCVKLFERGDCRVTSGVPGGGKSKPGEKLSRSSSRLLASLDKDSARDQSIALGSNSSSVGQRGMTLNNQMHMANLVLQSAIADERNAERSIENLFIQVDQKGKQVNMDLQVAIALARDDRDDDLWTKYNEGRAELATMSQQLAELQKQDVQPSKKREMFDSFMTNLSTKRPATAGGDISSINSVVSGTSAASLKGEEPQSSAALTPLTASKTTNEQLVHGQTTVGQCCSEKHCTFHTRDIACNLRCRGGGDGVQHRCTECRGPVHGGACCEGDPPHVCLLCARGTQRC